MSGRTVLCTHACLFVRVHVQDYMFVYVLVVTVCVSVCLGSCLSDSAVCLTVPVSAPHPLLVSPSLCLLLSH